MYNSPIMLLPTESQQLAELLYPDVKQTREDIEAKYPPRQLPEGAMVTRFAPSPTGFVHIGGIYASLISKTLAEQSKGIFYLRIEDTDQRREIVGGASEIIRALQDFQLPPMEGYVAENKEFGDYVPYLQSRRADIYAVFAKWLVAHGFAYPCFCSEEELAAQAAEQKAQNLQKKGYYGKWAKHRDMAVADVEKALQVGQKFILRVRAPETPGKARFKDLVRGKVEVEANATDMVLIKSNGLPTYHFAHVVDDYLMGTTHVTRGEEWLSTAPLHIQLFEMFGIKVPTYVHFSHIGKIEDGKVRKLSKRKDPEAAVSMYTEKGYPAVAVLEYLLNLANSGFSDWRRTNPTLSYKEFPFDARKIGKSIAIFDQKKLDDIGRDVVAKMSEQEIFEYVVTWAEKFAPDFAKLLKKDPEYSKKIFAIERYQDRPRKDIWNWSSVPTLTWYFFDELFPGQKTFELSPKVDLQTAKAVLQYFIDSYNPADTKEVWTENSRALAEKLGYARDIKSFKQNPENFKGHVGDVMSVLRLALTRESNTPDLYQVMQVLGKDRVITRLQAVLNSLI